MTDKEKKEYEAFKYYYQTNTEKGISYIPDYMCENVLNLIEKQSKEIEELKENKEEYIKKLEETKNKLVRYIAVKERKDFEQVCKEFEI